MERPSMILFKTSYHPNWRATVDGMDRPTVMLMPGFIGVYLESGRHSVVMKYRARVLRPALMWIGFITLIAIGLWNTRKARDLSRKVLFNASTSMKRRL